MLDLIQEIIDALISFISDIISWDIINNLISKLVGLARSLIQDRSMLGTAIVVTGILWALSSTITKILKIIFFVLLIVGLLIVACDFLYG